MAFNAEHIKWFRDSSPYIDAHRDGTFVVNLPDHALVSSNLNNIISDIALLNSLDVRVVVVYGADEQISKALGKKNLAWPFQDGRRITDPDLLETITGTLGSVTADLSARISASRPDSPAAQREITTATGNFVKARPFGIIDGIDHQLSGHVRKINSDAISHQLDGGAIVLIPALGFSPSGETFHLEADAVASHVAQALSADKLIYMIGDEGLRDSESNVINEIDLSQANQAQLQHDKLLNLCDQACKQGVSRCHVISFETDGALLEELFTRDGCGTQIVGHSYERIRQAGIDDVPGILRLIEPLEASGVLVKRSRELIESEIDGFIVIERDGLLISCAALYPYDAIGELACLVTHPDYRNGDRGDRLLDAIINKARTHGLEQLFVLTTQSVHWFAERGFNQCEPDALPQEKKDFYNYQRNSQVLFRAISAPSK